MCAELVKQPTSLIATAQCRAWNRFHSRLPPFSPVVSDICSFPADADSASLLRNGRPVAGAEPRSRISQFLFNYQRLEPTTVALIARFFS